MGGRVFSPRTMSKPLREEYLTINTDMKMQTFGNACRGRNSPRRIQLISPGTWSLHLALEYVTVILDQNEILT